MEEKGPEVEDYISQYTDVFTGEGKLEGLLHLEIDKNVQPVQLPTRKVLIALREPLKQELDRLSNIGVIRKVDTPTNWISALVVTAKKNGKVRLCIDPKPLNEALPRNHYPLPTIDDVLPLIKGPCVHSIGCKKMGSGTYSWTSQVALLLPLEHPRDAFGGFACRLVYPHLQRSFRGGLILHSKAYQGKKAIADNILVFGAGDTDEEALKDHDRNLREVFNRCR